MKFHQIQVDDEVYKYLKEKAEPFVDTPNSVLRRELPLKSWSPVPVPPAPVVESRADGTFPDIPRGIPATLQEILEVAHLVTNRGYGRPDATMAIANKHGIAYQTVLDKYTRQLGLMAYQFDRLLEQPDLTELKAMLRKKFPHHSNIINQYLKGR